MTPFEDRPDIRKVLYTVQYVVSGAMLLLGVAWATLPNQGVPQWYVTASAVLSALWAYTGITAAANVPTSTITGEHAPTQENGPQDGDLPDDEVEVFDAPSNGSPESRA